MPIHWKVETFVSLESTQDVVKDRSRAGAAEGAVIQALTQTGGRGRRGNEWTSPLGNLYMSFLLRPLCRPDLAGQISFVAGLAVSAAIDDILASGHTKTLKWPNDVLIDGRKCAGILLEAELASDTGLVESLFIGIGVNILAPPEGASGLAQVCGTSRVAVHPFRDRVLSAFSTLYEGWRAGGFEPVRREWLSQAHGLNEKMTARLGGDRREEGIFRDIDPTGALILQGAGDKTVVVRAGDVYFG